MTFRAYAAARDSHRPRFVYAPPVSDLGFLSHDVPIQVTEHEVSREQQVLVQSLITKGHVPVDSWLASLRLSYDLPDMSTFMDLEKGFKKQIHGPQDASVFRYHPCNFATIARLVESDQGQETFVVPAKSALLLEMYKQAEKGDLIPGQAWVENPVLGIRKIRAVVGNGYNGYQKLQTYLNRIRQASQGNPVELIEARAFLCLYNTVAKTLGHKLFYRTDAFNALKGYIFTDGELQAMHKCLNLLFHTSGVGQPTAGMPENIMLGVVYAAAYGNSETYACPAPTAIVGGISTKHKIYCHACVLDSIKNHAYDASRGLVDPNQYATYKTPECGICHKHFRSCVGIVLDYIEGVVTWNDVLTSHLKKMHLVAIRPFDGIDAHMLALYFGVIGIQGFVDFEAVLEKHPGVSRGNLLNMLFTACNTTPERVGDIMNAVVTAFNSPTSKSTCIPFAGESMVWSTNGTKLIECHFNRSLQGKVAGPARAGMLVKKYYDWLNSIEHGAKKLYDRFYPSTQTVFPVKSGMDIINLLDLGIEEYHKRLTRSRGVETRQEAQDNDQQSDAALAELLRNLTMGPGFTQGSARASSQPGTSTHNSASSAPSFPTTGEQESRNQRPRTDTHYVPPTETAFMEE